MRFGGYIRLSGMLKQKERALKFFGAVGQSETARASGTKVYEAE